MAFKTVQLKDELLSELREVSKLIEADTGLSLSDAQTIRYLLKVYKDNQEA